MSVFGANSPSIARRGTVSSDPKRTFAHAMRGGAHALQSITYGKAAITAGCTASSDSVNVGAWYAFTGLLASSSEASWDRCGGHGLCRPRARHRPPSPRPAGGWWDRAGVQAGPCHTSPALQACDSADVSAGL